jgi:hypothetical protein
VPKGVTEIGAPVNPVHVLDLAFILPGMIITAAALRKRKPLGLLFAAPLLTFSAVMGVAILAMFAAERARGRATSVVPVVVIGIGVAATVYGAWAFIRPIEE